MDDPLIVRAEQFGTWTCHNGHTNLGDVNECWCGDKLEWGWMHDVAQELLDVYHIVTKVNVEDEVDWADATEYDIVSLIARHYQDRNDNGR